MQSGFRIFHVEDNPADAEILRIAMAQTGVPCEITVFESGAEILSHLDLLSGSGAALPACDLVLLDLNLPTMSGFEVLERIRSRRHLAALRIIVMSGSRNPEEIDRCLRLGANSYLPKCSQISETYGVAKQIAGILREG